MEVPSTAGPCQDPKDALAAGDVALSMHPAVRTANLIVLILPFVAFIAAIVLLWNRLVGWSDLAIFVVMYLGTVIGVTVGFHRMFTHRAFEAGAPLRISLAALGSLAVQGPVIGWVADQSGPGRGPVRRRHSQRYLLCID